jgi:DNA-binding FrmR family transcriptional regulator
VSEEDNLKSVTSWEVSKAEKGEFMSQSEEPAREDPHSLAPIAIGGTSDDQDIANMKSGRGMRVVLTLVVAAAAVVGGAQLLRSMDDRQTYVLAASQLERSDIEQRDAFMRCALPNYQRSQLTNAGSLRNAVESASERMNKNYAKLIAKCTPQLASFQQAVTDIKAPEDVSTQVSAVNKAVIDLGLAFNNYRDFLQQKTYDPTEAAPLIDAIASSWQSYLTTREKAKQALSAKL